MTASENQIAQLTKGRENPTRISLGYMSAGEWKWKMERVRTGLHTLISAVPHRRPFSRRHIQWPLLYPPAKDSQLSDLTLSMTQIASRGAPSPAVMQLPTGLGVPTGTHVTSSWPISFCHVVGEVFTGGFFSPPHPTGDYVTPSSSSDDPGHPILPGPISDQRPRRARKLGWEIRPRPMPISASTERPTRGQKGTPPRTPSFLLSFHHRNTPRPALDQQPRRAQKLGWEIRPRPTPISASIHILTRGKGNMPVRFIGVFSWSDSSNLHIASSPSILLGLDPIVGNLSAAPTSASSKLRASLHRSILAAMHMTVPMSSPVQLQVLG